MLRSSCAHLPCKSCDRFRSKTNISAWSGSWPCNLSLAQVARLGPVCNCDVQGILTAQKPGKSCRASALPLLLDVTATERRVVTVEHRPRRKAVLA